MSDMWDLVDKKILDEFTVLSGLAIERSNVCIHKTLENRRETCLAKIVKVNSVR